MFCYKCGKEISDQAQFCNYCGAQMGNAQPVAASATQPAQQPAAPQGGTKKSKGSLGAVIFMLICGFVVCLIANTISNKSHSAPKETTDFQGFVLYNQSLMDGCINGALYQNNDLTYGQARLHMPGYSLMPGENGSGDWLISSDDSSLFSVNRQLEIGISYDASDADGILKSYANDGVSNVSMVSFRKYMVDGSPVIRYIIKGTVDGLDEYIGELIVFPDKKPSETMRLSMVNLAEIGYDRIDQVFDTLEISSEFTLTQNDTQAVGYNRITAK